MGSQQQLESKATTLDSKQNVPICNSMAGNNRVPMTMRDFFFDDPFFKSSWDNFDQDFRDMACMSNNIMIDSEAQQKKAAEVAAADSSAAGQSQALDRQNSLTKWENGWMFPRRWMLPSLKSEFRDMDLFKEKDSEVIRVKN